MLLFFLLNFILKIGNFWQLEVFFTEFCCCVQLTESVESFFFFEFMAKLKTET